MLLLHPTCFHIQNASKKLGRRDSLTKSMRTKHGNKTEKSGITAESLFGNVQFAKKICWVINVTLKQ